MNGEEPQGPLNPDVEALRKEIEFLRKDMERQKTELDGRIEMLNERTSNVKDIVNVVILALIVSVIGTLAATIILRAAGL